MIRKILFSAALFITTWFGTCFGQKVTGEFAIHEVSDEQLHAFSRKISQESKRHMEFYYEQDSSNVVDGFVYLLSDTLNFKLFYRNKSMGTLYTFESIKIKQESYRRKIIDVFHSMLKYKRNPCYNGELGINPETNYVPKPDTKFYWKYWLFYYEDGFHKRAWRDKISLDKDGCGSRRSKLRSRRDFEKLRENLNKILTDLGLKKL